MTFGAKRFEVVGVFKTFLLFPEQVLRSEMDAVAVGGFVNAVLLLSLSLYVALDAVPRIFRPPVLDGSDEWVAIAAIGAFFCGCRCAI